MTRGLVLILMTAHLASFGFGACGRFATEGESRALAAGLAHWTAGDFGMADDRPPSARMLATLPCLMLHPTIGDVRGRELCHDPAIWSRFEDRIAGDLAGSMLPDAYLDMVRLARLAGLSWWLVGAWLVFR